MPWSRCRPAAAGLFVGVLVLGQGSAAAQARTQPESTPRPALPAERSQNPVSPPRAPNSVGAPQPAPVVPAAPVLAPPRFVVMLDAAHGGDDLGGHLSSGQLEKNANLAFSVRLRSLLGARGFQVVTTRESDQSVD